MHGIRILTLITALAAIFFFSANALAESPESQANGETIIEQKVIITKVLDDGTVITEEGDTSLLDNADSSILQARTPKESDPLKKREMSKFMMGIELGTGLDVSSNDLSTFNADIIFGYRYKAIQLLGVQVGIHKSLGSRDSFIPLSLVFRTSFRSKPSLCFFHMNAGYSFNTISSSPMFGDITATIGCGVNLVQRPKFQSNIILGFGFRHFNRRHQEMTQIAKDNVGFAQISLGISI